MITGITDDQSEVFIHGDQYGAPYSGHRKFESTPTCIGPCSNFNLDFNDVGHNFDFKFKLKLIVDIEFDELNDEGNNHKTTLLLTYDVDDDNVIISNTDIDPTSNGLPINLDINNLTFNGQQVDGCSLSGNKYVCKSVYDINVKDVNMSPGYEVEMIAGRAIYVDATSVFTPESLLRIANHPYYNHAPNTPISSTISFCTTNPNDDNHYHANQPTTRLEAYVDSLKNNDSDVNFKEKRKLNLHYFLTPQFLSNRFN